jgi:polyisoprenoid-binding protein YceI
MTSKFFVILILLYLYVANAMASEIFKADEEHTFISLSYNHMGFSTQTIRFDKVFGTIILDPQTKSGKLDITIAIPSISTGSAIFNDRIQEDDLFASHKFPTASFISDRIVFNQDVITSVLGELTIKGISKTVELKVNQFSCGRNFLTFKYTCGANAIAQINRSDFNLGKYTPLVSDAVTIQIVIEAIQEK